MREHCRRRGTREHTQSSPLVFDQLSAAVLHRTHARAKHPPVVGSERASERASGDSGDMGCVGRWLRIGQGQLTLENDIIFCLYPLRGHCGGHLDPELA